MDKEINNIDYTELIGKYLAHETTVEEISLLENWVLENSENKRTFNNYKQAWILTKQQKQVVDVNNEWNKISSQLFTAEKSIKPKNNIFFKIAAAAIILIVSSYSVFYISSNNDNILIADNSVMESTLKDGSLITLNHNSKLEITDDFNENKRKVKLTGNAFFDISRDENKPFIIECNNIEIEVLGTSFYIKSDGKNNEVIVESGTVSVKQINNESNNIVLIANEKCVCDDNKLIKVVNGDVNFMSWKTKILSFKNKKLVNVIEKINETYHTNIKINSPEINNCRITAQFDNKSVDAVLNILQATLDLEVDKKDTEIIISGKSCE